MVQVSYLQTLQCHRKSSMEVLLLFMNNDVLCTSRSLVCVWMTEGFLCCVVADGASARMRFLKSGGWTSVGVKRPPSVSQRSPSPNEGRAHSPQQHHSYIVARYGLARLVAARHAIWRLRRSGSQPCDNHTDTDSYVPL